VRIAGEDLVTLVRAHPGSRSFKAHAIDERWGARPFRSYSHLKGRTDVYRFPRGRLALVFRNMGYFVGHTTRPEYLKRDPVVYLEPRIPRLDYRPESRVLSIGSAAGGYTQAFRKYIPDARITGVEIDGSFREICRDPAIAPFVPDLSSYELVFEDGRRFAETTGKRFDVVCASIDSINSLEPDYADERTSMLVTREAFSAYFRILEPGGYLLVEQFYPRTRGGEAMVLKMLKTLAAASGDSPEVLRERIFMYSWSFSPDPASQRFAVIVYGQSMGLGDRKIFLDWIRTMRGEHPDFRAINIHDIRVLHCAALPGGREWVYGPYFSSWRRTRLEKDYRTGIITDSRPFRHGIRKTPFPPRYYVLYLALLGIFASVLLFSKRRDPGIFRKDGGLWGAVYFGISTFPLQYLLYYRTAARFGTSLIYYGVFLAIPLFFSALGGWISTTLKPGQFKAWIGIFLCAGGVIASINPFHYPVVLVFPLVALLFVFAGMPFPMVLQRRSGPEGRARLYAANLFSGGFAFLPWVTLHARAGWEASFGVCLAALAFGSWMLARRRAERPV
jgi:SAM-dependent methyltransferase